MTAARTAAALADVLDELDTLGVSNERLQILVDCETEAFRRRRRSACKARPDCGGDAQTLPRDVRDWALLFLRHLVFGFRLPESTWCTAQVVLDAYCAQASEVDAVVSELPCLCLSVVTLLKKMDSVMDPPTRYQRFALPQGVAFAEMLRSKGYNAKDPTEIGVGECERHALQATSWQVSLPSAEAWMQLFRSRFDVFSCGVFATSLSWVIDNSTAFLSAMVRWRPATAEFPPRIAAAGLFGLRLIGAGMLPRAALKPEAVSHDDWAAMFQAVFREDDAASARAAAVSDERRARILETLVASLGMRLEEIVAAADLVSQVLRELSQSAPM
mmetsp:Transcript_41044/g.117976  ORF Transcript_41044/g.117976 Transcript_41044/m.117976 type:complete len:330 (+) Transcript_41044:68-1057(+)